MNTCISTSYFCAVPLLEDIRALDHIGQAKVCEAFAKWLDRNPNVDSMFIERFRESFVNYHFTVRVLAVKFWTWGKRSYLS